MRMPTLTLPTFWYCWSPYFDSADFLVLLIAILWLWRCYVLIPTLKSTTAIVSRLLNPSPRRSLPTSRLAPHAPAAAAPRGRCDRPSGQVNTTVSLACLIEKSRPQAEFRRTGPWARGRSEQWVQSTRPFQTFGNVDPPVSYKQKKYLPEIDRMKADVLSGKDANGKVREIVVGPVLSRGVNLPSGLNLAKYFDEKGRFFNVLDFFSDHRGKFPVLWTVVQCEAAMRNVEVGCERFFSLSGYISAPRRTRLGVRTYERLALLASNLPKLYVDKEWVAKEYLRRASMPSFTAHQPLLNWVWKSSLGRKQGKLKSLLLMGATKPQQVMRRRWWGALVLNSGETYLIHFRGHQSQYDDLTNVSVWSVLTQPSFDCWKLRCHSEIPTPT